MLIVHLILILLIVLEALCGYVLVTANIWLKILALALHFAAVAAGYFVFKKWETEPFKAEKNFLYTMLALSAVLPFYGLLGMYVTAVCVSHFSLQHASYFKLEDDLVPENARLASRRQLDEIEVQQGLLDMQAFRDILRSNDRDLEERAIRKLSHLMTRESVAILQEVVRTATSDIRLAAASALIDMEDEVINEIERLRLHLQQAPNDVESRLQLARTYDLYAYLGVSDKVLRLHYNELATEEYRAYLATDPKNARVILEYGRTLLAAGEVDKAKRVLSTAVNLAPGNATAQLWLAEAYYEAGDYNATAAVCRRVHTYSYLPEALRPVANWWSDEEEEGVCSPDEVIQ